MSNKMGKRIIRPATPEERKRHDEIRRQIELELPELREQAKQMFREALSKHVSILDVAAALKAERERQGLTLADISERSGIEPAILSQFESGGDTESLDLLDLYAQAIGKEVRVLLTDSLSAQWRSNQDPVE